ncbi:TolB family protein [Actinokineospora sp. 24-640]
MNSAQTTSGVAAAALAIAAVVATAVPAQAAAVDIRIVDVLPHSPFEVIQPSATPSVSHDGRLVAFSAGRVHVRDTATGQEVFRSDRSGFTPVLSGNGAVLAYRDVDGLIQVVDLATGTREFASRGMAGATPNGPSANPDLSFDGRLVVFDSDATNLTGGDALGNRDIFRFDRLTDTTTALSKTHNSWGNGDSTRPSISQNGTVVAFESAATSFGGFDTNGKTDVYVRAANGTFRRASVPTGGFQANGNSTAPDLNGAGQVVVFESDATNLTDGDYAASRDVFTHDLTTGVTNWISADKNGNGRAFSALNPSVSTDGRRVVFRGKGGYVAGDVNELEDVYLVDLDHPVGSDDRVRIVSETEDGQLANGASIQPRVSGDGTRVVFVSGASNLVAADPDGTRLDTFLRVL